ncbi:MAG: phage tail protein [Acidimicrobiales bacterium]
MRGLIEGEESPLPIVDLLPGMLQDDMFVQRFAAGIDAVMAPIFLTLDNLEAYLDPSTAPSDFVRWLGDWVGIALDENWPIERRRALVLRSVDLFRWRGTVGGLAAHVELYVGTAPEVVESGGVSWSEAPNARLPGDDVASLLIRVRPPDPAAFDVQRLERIVSTAKPAYVPHRVEVLAP